MVLPTRRVTPAESIGQEFNTLIKCIEFSRCGEQCFPRILDSCAPVLRARMGTGEIPILEDGSIFIIFHSVCTIDFYDCKHLALQVLALRLLIITCAMCCAIVVDRLGRNTCVTGDSVDRNLATAIGRADS